jgi:hypothetical protein
VTFEEYSSRWLTERRQPRPRTRELYDGQPRLHILPVLDETGLAQITPSRIRKWRADMISAGKPGASTIAKNRDAVIADSLSSMITEHRSKSS